MFRSIHDHRDLDVGASSVEYALLLVGIAGILVIVIYALGGQTQPMFENTCEKIDTKMSASATCA